MKNKVRMVSVKAFRLDELVLSKLELICQREDRTASNAVRKAIMEYQVHE